LYKYNIFTCICSCHKIQVDHEINEYHKSTG
jgi:hypothetical protein